MSHQILKNIALKRFITKPSLVRFLEKSNNDTSPFKRGTCTIPRFVLNCWGGIYQHNYSSIHSIIEEMKRELAIKGYDDPDLWLDFSRYIEDKSTHLIKAEITTIFFRACDRINNLVSIE